MDDGVSVGAMRRWHSRNKFQYCTSQESRFDTWDLQNIITVVEMGENCRITRWCALSR